MANSSAKLDFSRLKHRPLFLLPYERHDGRYHPTDCKFLSLGWAQYDPQSLSLKALRHTGSKWSRQSEEVPLHRAIDMVILLAHTLTFEDDREVQIRGGTLENQPSTIKLKLTSDTLRHSNQIRRLLGDPLLRSRLRALKEALAGLDL